MEPKKTNYQTDPGTWQTGRTEPPKGHSTLISVLLVLVILLCGISTALSILNFKLYQQLTVQKVTPQVSFSRGTEVPETDQHQDLILSLEGFGIQGTVIPTVYQRYSKLPNGIYVTKVSSTSEAFTKGVVTGDIITKVGEVSITDSTALEQLCAAFTPGQEVSLEMYRNGMESTLTLIWNE